MAESFGEAAARAGVERIVYLGGIVPEHAAPSPHLRSRLEVEEILLAAVPGSTALRASIVIGAGRRRFASSFAWSSGCGCCRCRAGATTAPSRSTSAT